MLEELYIKIKENDSDVVICNSQNFEKKIIKKNINKLLILN